MNRKLTWAALILGLIVVLTIAGCGSGTPAPRAATPAPTATAAPPTATPGAAPITGATPVSGATPGSVATPSGIGQVGGTITSYESNTKVGEGYIMALGITRDAQGQPTVRPDVDVTKLPTAKLDASGNFSLTKVPAGDYVFAVNKNGNPQDPNFSPVGDSNKQIVVTTVKNGETAKVDGFILSARLEAPTPVPVSTPPVAMEIDPTKTYTATIKTDVGDIKVQLYANRAPVTVNNFVHLARTGFYNNTTFHRVIEGFMAQGGDPTGTGTGGPGYEFKDEIVPDLKFDQPGVLAMANAGANTNGSQFFITFEPTPWLDGKHTIFGKVVAGQDVLPKIVRRDPQDPKAPAATKITGITIEEK